MRKAASFVHKEQAIAFSLKLKEFRIDSEIETVIDQEPHQYIVWVIAEDDFPRALQELGEFEKNPEGIKNRKIEPPVSPRFEGPDQKEFDEVRAGRTIREEIARLSTIRSGVRMKSLWTKAILALCVLVYFTSAIQKVELIKTTSPSLLLPLISPIERYFLYEYPKAFEYSDELIHKYQYKDEKELMALPPEGEALVKKIEGNPPWGGFYRELIAKIEKKTLTPHLLFQDIREGQVWRMVTPIFLHSDLLHILFNMLWLWLLGRLIEVRLGAVRYLALIVIIASVTNTLQYLVSGPFFMGFSGVITGMAGFIWMRQITSPLEVYPVHKGAIIFLWIFIIAMFLLQCLAFFLQIFNPALEIHHDRKDE
jgi:GlpG protein